MYLTKAQKVSFQKALFEFCTQSSLDKPWKKDKNPYKIWVFEVVMQQTRMDQGMPYYERIIEKFPRIQDLANATEDDLFSVWKGLGYYSRARNLHFTSKYIVDEMNGKFPDTYIELLKLKGVGEYTAAAIASFAFGQDVAVLDGNVHRVLARIFGIPKTIQSSTAKRFFQSLIDDLLFQGESSTFNQAMMDMGSFVCKPQIPNCLECVFSSQCKGYNLNRIADYPPAKFRPILKERHFYCIFVKQNDKFYLEKREKNDIWKGLYQGIMQEGEKIDLQFWKAKGIPIAKVKWSDMQTQTLSHQFIKMKIGVIELETSILDSSSYFEIDRLKAIPMPRILSKWWENQFK